MLILYLAIASVTVLLGAGIALVFREKEAEFQVIFGFTAGAVLGLVLMLMVHLFTEVGYPAILVMWGGFLLIWLLEHFTHRMHTRFSTHAEGQKRYIWGVNITIIGLSIHSVMDGVSLSIAAEKQTEGIALALGILLHRFLVVPVITTGLRRNYGFGQTALWLMPFIIAPIVGAFMGERLLHGIFEEFADYLFAFAVGTLLHVVMDGLRGGHASSGEKISNSTKIAVVVGLILTICVMCFLPVFEHGYEHVH